MSEDQNKPIFTSLAGAVKLIANTPKVRFLLRGEYLYPIMMMGQSTGITMRDSNCN